MRRAEGFVVTKEKSARKKAARKAGLQTIPVVPPAEPRSDFFAMPEPVAAPLSIPWITKVLLIAVILLGAVLRFANSDNVTLRNPDEYIYKVHASQILKSGLAGLRVLAQAQLAYPSLQVHPPPTRIGFTVPLALSMRLTSLDGEQVGVYLCCAVSILTLLAVVWIGLRFLGPWPALFGALFLAAFPPELAIARRCWTDAPAGLAGLLTFYFTMEIFCGRRKWYFYIPLVIAGTEAVLIKETMVLVYGPCLIVALLVFLFGKDRDFVAAGRLIGAAALGAVITVALLAYSAGGLTVPLTVIRADAHANISNPYALNYQNGPGYLLLWAFEALSPVTFVLAAFAALCITLRNRHRRCGIALLAWLTSGFLTVFMLVPLWLNLRYVTAAYGPLCLLAGTAVWQAFLMIQRKLPTQAARAVMALAVAVIMFSVYADYQRFQRGFIRIPTNDLSTGLIRAAVSN